MAVDDQSEISISIPQGTLPWPVVVGFIHRTHSTVRSATDSLDAGGQRRSRAGFASHLVYTEESSLRCYD